MGMFNSIKNFRLINGDIMIKNIRIKDINTTNINLDLENFTFFWSGIFSQWHKSNFTIGGITFNTAEQYMMYNKAILFNDFEIAHKILETNNPKTQKNLGRKVSNYNAEIWGNECDTIVYMGNYAKFTQNKKLLKELLDTGNTTLVEASPYDIIWGIGLSEDDAKNVPYHQWEGQNKLGLILTVLRNNLRG